MLAELFYVMYCIDNSLTPAGTTQFLRLHHEKNVVKAPNPSPDIAVPSRIPEGRLFPNGDPGYSIVQSQRTRQEQRSSSWFSERLRKRSGAGLSLKKFLPLQTPRLCHSSFSELHQPSQDRNTADASWSFFRKEHRL